MGSLEEEEDPGLQGHTPTLVEVILRGLSRPRQGGAAPRLSPESL